MPDVLRTPDGSVVRQSPKPKQFLVELAGERPYPFTKLLRNESFQYFCERVACSVILIARRLVHPCDDSDVCAGSPSYVCLFRHVVLSWPKNSSISCL